MVIRWRLITQYGLPWVSMFFAWGNLYNWNMYCYDRVLEDDPDMAMFYTILFDVSISLSILCFFLTRRTHAGSIPDSPEWYFDEETELGEVIARNKIEEINNKESDHPENGSSSDKQECNKHSTTTIDQVGGRPVCRVCKKYKPPRTHHCRQCKICILKMDHHCPWTGTCIGYYNHKYFLLNLFYGAFGFTIYLWTQYNQFGIEWSKPFSEKQGTYFFFICFNMVLLIPFYTLAIGSWLLAANNVTTIEFRHAIRAPQTSHVRIITCCFCINDYNFGIWSNLADVLGHPLVWFLPVRWGMYGNGLSYRETDYWKDYMGFALSSTHSHSTNSNSKDEDILKKEDDDNHNNDRGKSLISTTVGMERDNT